MPDGTASEVSPKVSEGEKIILNKAIAPRYSNVVDTSILDVSGIKLIRAFFSADIFLRYNIFRFARMCPVRDARWSRETSVSRWVFNIVKVETKCEQEVTTETLM